MKTDRKIFPVRNISIAFFESDDMMSAGVARYITKSLIGERSIFFHLPKKYPKSAMRKTGRTTSIIWLIMALHLLRLGTTIGTELILRRKNRIDKNRRHRNYFESD